MFFRFLSEEVFASFSEFSLLDWKRPVCAESIAAKLLPAAAGSKVLFRIFARCLLKLVCGVFFTLA